VSAFTGLRWEEAVAVPLVHLSLGSQSMLIDRTASQSGGRRDARETRRPAPPSRPVMRLPCGPLAVIVQHGKSVRSLSALISA
jgi:hypothetical protein